MSDRLRILIADDHEIVREGLRTLLAEEPGLEPVGEAATLHTPDYSIDGFLRNIDLERSQRVALRKHRKTKRDWQQT